jgi:hypothetical protein
VNLRPLSFSVFSDAKCGFHLVAEGRRRSESREQSTYEHKDARPAAKDAEERKEVRVRVSSYLSSSCVKAEERKEVRRDRDERGLANQVMRVIQTLIIACGSLLLVI